MDTHSQRQKLANNSKIENSRNKSHAKISEFKVSQVKSSIVYLCLTSVYIKTYLTYKTHIYIYNCHSERIARDNKSYRFQVYTV